MWVPFHKLFIPICISSNEHPGILRAFFFLVYEENWLVCGIVFLLCVTSSGRAKEKTHLSLNCVGTSVKSTKVSFKSLLSLLYASVSSCISPSAASCPLPVLQFGSITSDHQGRFWALSATWIWKGLSWRPVAHAENYKNFLVVYVIITNYLIENIFRGMDK